MPDTEEVYMLTDPIADMLTRIRNAQLAGKSQVIVPYSKLKLSIAKVLVGEGFIKSFFIDEGVKKNLILDLKYYSGKPVISNIKRVSSPGLRVFKNKDKIPTVLGGLGIAIVSTSKGLMSDKEARQLNIGGEVICFVS